MALIEPFFSSPRPGWMSRGKGRRYVEICTLAFDGIVEGLYQGRLNLFGVDPHPSAIPYIARDTGIVPGVFETVRSYMLRRRRRRWSWRAAGLAGVANLHVDATDWVDLGGGIPIAVSGTPTEAGNVLRINVDGVVGAPGVMFSVSTDGGATFGASTALGTDTTISVGDVDLEFRNGQVLPAFDLPLYHGGRGLLLNDFGAPVRAEPGASPAGDESILHEVAAVVGACRIRLVSANGTWWTREADGYTWRLSGGPWAWETAKDSDPTYWARGLVIIDEPPNIDRWELFSAGAHYLGEPQASFGTTATMEWWNRLRVTLGNFNTGAMRIEAVILNFDPTKFDPSDASTCPQGDWYVPHKDDGAGNIIPSRPIEYAWFSDPM